MSWGRFSPAEVLLGGEATENRMLRGVLTGRLECCTQVGEQRLFDRAEDLKVLTEQFPEQNISDQGLEESPATLMACGGLVIHLREIEKSDLCHINHLEYYITRSVYGIGFDCPAESGTHRDHAQQGKAGQPPVGAGSYQNGHGADGCSDPGWKNPCCGPEKLSGGLLRWKNW